MNVSWLWLIFWRGPFSPSGESKPRNEVTRASEETKGKTDRLAFPAFYLKIYALLYRKSHIHFHKENFHKKNFHGKSRLNRKELPLYSEFLSQKWRWIQGTDFTCQISSKQIWWRVMHANQSIKHSGHVVCLVKAFK